MGNRSTLHMSERAGQTTDPKPKCAQYLSWLARKDHLQKSVFTNLLLDDQLKIAHEFQPGQIDASMHWNFVAQRLTCQLATF